MTGVRDRSLSIALLTAVLGTAVAVAAPSGLRVLMAEVGLRSDEGFIMGGTGNPLPDPDYITGVTQLYLQPDPVLFQGQPTFDTYDFGGLTTPEQFCPIVCTSSQPDLGFGDSVNVGVGDLSKAILPDLKLGDDVAVLGYSQSATVATVEMNNLINDTPAGVDLDDLHMILLGDPNSPIGGILDRFQFPDAPNGDPQQVPSLDIPLSLATTPTTGIDTDIYTAEYDGFADFPEDPSNISADINALIGIQTVHPYYPDPTPGVNLDTDNILDIGKIGDTNFYAIPAPLPTLAFLYDGGPAGRFLYDSLSPSAILQDDWAYGNPGDPGAGVPADGIVAGAGPWQVDATGQLMQSGVVGFDLKMDPLQMLAGMQYAEAQSIIGPMNDLLADTGQAPLSQSVVDSLLSGYDYTNQLDASFLAELTTLSATYPALAPDTLFDGAPAISGQPLIDLVGDVFSALNGT